LDHWFCDGIGASRTGAVACIGCGAGAEAGIAMGIGALETKYYYQITQSIIM
jgi:hypothetical protein